MGGDTGSIEGLDLSKGMTVVEASQCALDADTHLDLAALLGIHLVLGTIHPRYDPRRPIIALLPPPAVGCLCARMRAA